MKMIVKIVVIKIYKILLIWITKNRNFHKKKTSNLKILRYTSKSIINFSIILYLNFSRDDEGHRTIIPADRNDIIIYLE